MKFILTIIAAVLLIGCAGPKRENRIRAYEKKLTADWIKTNIVIGKTTKEEIRMLSRKSTTESDYMASGIGTALMPIEMWTHSVRFTYYRSSSNIGADNRTRSVVFSFKGEKVSAVNTARVKY